MSWPSWTKAISISFALTLTACSGSWNPLVNKPDSIEGGGVDAQLQSLRIRFDPSWVSSYELADGDAKTRLRDNIVYARMSAEDLIFEKFEWAIWGTNAGTVTASDLAVLGLTAAASLASGGSANALSAAATGVGGAKLSIQKNFLFDRTMDQLVFSMTLTRSRIRTHIESCLAQPDSQYSLSVALYDLTLYHEAGVLPSAIASMAASAAKAVQSDSSPCGSNAVGAPNPTMSLQTLLGSLTPAQIGNLEAAMASFHLTPVAPGNLQSDQSQVITWASTATPNQLNSAISTLQAELAMPAPASPAVGGKPGEEANPAAAGNKTPGLATQPTAIGPVPELDQKLSENSISQEQDRDKEIVAATQIGKVIALENSMQAVGVKPLHPSNLNSDKLQLMDWIDKQSTLQLTQLEAALRANGIMN